MKRFTIDVRVVGFSQVTVKAETQEEAEDKAADKVMAYKVSDLRWKETTYDHLSSTDIGGA